MAALLCARALRSSLALAAVFVVAACGGGPPPETFDLSAAPVAKAHGLRAQISISEPIASPEVDTQRILVRTGPETLAYMSGGQWSDRLPALVQHRLLQTFQNARLLKSVGLAGSGIAADYDLELDIRAFELDVKGVQANVDIAVKIVTARSGHVAAAEIFQAQAPAAGTSAAAAAAALNAALSAVMAQIVAFTGKQI